MSGVLSIRPVTREMESITGSSDRGKTSKPPSPVAESFDASLYPTRFQPFIPPPNYGAVQNGQIYRSSFPQARNIKFIQALNIKTLLCLVATEPSEECSSLVQQNGINRLRVDIAANKEGQVASTLRSVYEALLVIMDATNYPIYIHCNQGRHRTGCVIACLRRMQGWSVESAIEEYETYAAPKAREGDIKLIRDVFRPELMLDYVKQNVQFDNRPSLMQLLRSDLVDVSVAKFVNILASMDGVVPVKDSLKSNTSSRADSAVEVYSTLPKGTAPALDPAYEIMIEECGPLSPTSESQTVWN